MCIICDPNLKLILMTEPKTVLTNGEPVPADRSHAELRENGQQKAYVVLTPEERAKGYVKPVRREYRHVGKRPRYPLLDLTPEKIERFKGYGYVKYEAYPAGSPEAERGLSGKYWTQRELNSESCRYVTTMGIALAETYARDPKFYSGTFCTHCAAHFNLDEFEWLDGEPMDVQKQAEYWGTDNVAEQERRRGIARETWPQVETTMIGCDVAKGDDATVAAEVRESRAVITLVESKSNPLDWTVKKTEGDTRIRAGDECSLVIDSKATITITRQEVAHIDLPSITAEDVAARMRALNERIEEACKIEPHLFGKSGGATELSAEDQLALSLTDLAEQYKRTIGCLAAFVQALAKARK